MSTLFGCADGGPSNGRNGGSSDAGADASRQCARDEDCIDDGIFCNGRPDCTPEGRCIAGRIPTCDDGVTCTHDQCVAATDDCQNTPDTSRCPEGYFCSARIGCSEAAACEGDGSCFSDGTFCNGDEVCAGVCMSPGMRDCSDEDSCTLDECVESMASCVQTRFADHLSNVAHCGPTGMNDCIVCAGPTIDQVNMEPLCTAGACLLGCSAGYADADQNRANGCECNIGLGVDDPDATFSDSDCDGIDGDRERGILISRSHGSDVEGCGLAFESPCASVGYGMLRGVLEGRRDMFVMEGRYDEIVDVRDGMRIFGGYDSNWIRGGRDAHRTELRGGFDALEGQWLTVKARGLTIGAMLENAVLVGPDASGANENGALSSYAVHASGSNLSLLRVTVVAGSAGPGSDGAEGDSAFALAAGEAMNGREGGRARESAELCDRSSHGAAGAAGVNVCDEALGNPNGGVGGAGGEKDRSCRPIGTCDRCDATAGDRGSDAWVAWADRGIGGEGGQGSSTCGQGLEGTDGLITNGAAGVGAIWDRGLMQGLFWYASPGAAGGIGRNGGGGGGGGGSGGCDVGSDSYGAGGGGGGAGGCAARAGGSGGSGGGGSFGVAAVAGSNVTAGECLVVRGAGGRGGNGGAGGRGQDGGAPGGAGPAGGDSRRGGYGGAGAHGGHGGGGGGGAGGASAAFLVINSSLDGGCELQGGSGGSGGAGGLSAPGAPIRDGADGTTGVAGLLENVLTP